MRRIFTAVTQDFGTDGKGKGRMGKLRAIGGRGEMEK